MRAVISSSALALLFLLQSGCASSSRLLGNGQVSHELELSFDDGQPADRPLLPPIEGEWLLRFEPTLPAYKPQRVRFLVAQPGKIRFSLYAQDASGRPGAKLFSVERAYEINHTSSGSDGKWVLESMGDVAALSGPVWLGISVPTADVTAARLWVSRKEATQAFSRDPEPGTALQSTPLKVTPMVRLLVLPDANVPQATLAQKLDDKKPQDDKQKQEDKKTQPAGGANQEQHGK